MSERPMSVISTRQEIMLSTVFVYPPIPYRDLDWSAVDASTFDADWDGELERYVTSCPQGSGATESDAIADLIEKIEDSPLPSPAAAKESEAAGHHSPGSGRPAFDHARLDRARLMDLERASGCYDLE